MLGDLLSIENDPELRKTIAYQLGNSDTKEAVDVLVKVINEDKSLEVRKAAVNALGNIDLSEAQDALLKILQK